jgi:hypothetical protein
MCSKNVRVLALLPAATAACAAVYTGGALEVKRCRYKNTRRPLAATRSPRAPSERRDAPKDTGIPFQNNSRLTALHAPGVTPIGCYSDQRGRYILGGLSHTASRHKPPQFLPQHAFTSTPQAREHAVHSCRIHLHHTQQNTNHRSPAAVTHLRARERKMLFSDAAVEIKRTVFKCKVVRPSGKPDDSIGSLLTAA